MTSAIPFSSLLTHGCICRRSIHNLEVMSAIVVPVRVRSPFLPPQSRSIDTSCSPTAMEPQPCLGASEQGKKQVEERRREDGWMDVGREGSRCWRGAGELLQTAPRMR